MASFFMRYNTQRKYSLIYVKPTGNEIIQQKQ